MALVAGDRLGPYEITETIGSGGMGDVYRARDTRLGRDVALKVLPDVFAQDPERLARFKREAHVLASLNHPHIAHIYGVEDDTPAGAAPGASVQHALVMELVEGVTLAELIEQSADERGRSEVSLSLATAAGSLRGGAARKVKRDAPVARHGNALPVDQALTIARQMAVALAAAHDHGIIHRDLKPANVKITDDGTVKVLDFGLAKPTSSGPAPGRSIALAADPTVTSPAATAPGAVLGTAAYMAPEQARGQHVDKRADIWSFGCVLYEMLTGRRPFTGEDVSETMASVLKSDPDWSALPADIPAAVRLLVERCLVKDRRRRVGDMSTAIFLIDEAVLFEPPPSRPVTQARVAWVIAAVASFIAVGALAGWFLTPGAEGPAAAQRTSLVLPVTGAVAFAWSPGQSIAISPDGREVAYVSPNEDAPAGRGTQLRVRTLDSRTVRDLPSTYQARQPFFSPDGRWVAFFTPAGELKKLSLAGGNPVTLAERIEGGQWAAGVWCEPDTIVFIGAGGLQRLSADGGTPRALTTINAAEREYSHYLWSYVPAARSVLFTATFSQGQPPRLDAVHIDTGARREVLANARGGWYVPSGHLVFTRDDALLVAPFDAERLALTGSAVPIVDEIRRDGAASEGLVPQLSVSRLGTLAYVPAVDTSGYLMGLVGTAGSAPSRPDAAPFAPVGLAAGRAQRPRVSPDGERVAFESADVVLVYDISRGTTTRLTTTGPDSGATWQPGGGGLALFSRRPDGRGIYFKRFNAASRAFDGREDRLLDAEESVVLRPESFTPDGQQLLYTRQRGSEHDIWALSLADRSASAILETAASEHSPKLSPNGHALAYVSDESGRSEVYVRAYPQGPPIRVSAAGGFAPVWSANSRQLFYAASQDGAALVMGAPVTWQGIAFTLGPSSIALHRRVRGARGELEQYAGGANWGPGYDVLPDGRFLVLRGPDPQGAREIVLVQHWFDELTRRVPPPK